ncbi:MAG TPA: ice-binding family protein [Patescibacteria group bacterium]|nr:ice-binding family protein [Patescibacteria group bacterium]
MKKINTYMTGIALAGAFVIGVVAFAVVSHNAYAAQPSVDLQTAAPFAILAGTGITDVPTSTISGNVGVSPASGATITGLTCPEVTGTIYTVDAAGPACRVVDGPLMVTAKNDLTAAFIDAAGRTPVTTVPTELGGTTKVAGVYDSASTTFQITAGAGPLVIDGQGDPNAVFIFEMGFSGTGLTVGPGSTVSLINGAQACNVFWKLDTAAINTTAVFKGTILALNSITVANGANIEGRLLARNGNVTLVSDTITRPTTCATTTSTTTTSTTTPKLPNTGIAPQKRLNSAWVAVPATLAGFVALASLYLIRKKRTV